MTLKPIARFGLVGRGAKGYAMELPGGGLSKMPYGSLA
jgi:hypothetical protein